MSRKASNAWSPHGVVFLYLSNQRGEAYAWAKSGALHLFDVGEMLSCDPS